MRLARAAIALALAVTGIVGGAACAAAPPPLRLSDSWPSQAGEFEDVNKAWTRKAILRGEYQQALEVYAIFRSPEWRAARAAHIAHLRNVQGSSRDAMMAAERTAAEGDYEVTLVVTTYERSENDLHHGERSVWRIALVDDAGVETAPTKIVRDRRPSEMLRAELPMLGDFATVYVATFPRASAVLHDGAKRVALRMWSARGSVELAWAAP
ncbi:MAG TPA: hypothetical protein VM261_38045 [Kofleriaceae bacterium]|nr:hypothetical protein [Kofleriaceae bacterium]